MEPRDGVVETTAAAGWLKAKPASGKDGEGEERPRSGGSMTVKHVRAQETHETGATDTGAARTNAGAAGS